MRIAYFYCGKEAHSRRKLCLESVNADFYGLIHKNPFASLVKALILGLRIFFTKKYDVLFTDNGVSLPAVYLLKFLGFKAKSVFYDVETYFAYMNRRSWLMKKYYLKLASCIDGYLCVAPLGADYIKKYFNKPIIVAPGFLWRSIEKFERKDFNKNFLYVKNYRWDGFHEFLIKSFELIQKQIPEAKLYLIGKDTVENVKRTSSIIPLGRIFPQDYYKKCTFYLHPGYHDPSPTSILEAMSYGMIPVTVKTVGNYYIVEKISKDLISEMNTEKFSETVLKIVKRKDLKKLSLKAQSIALQYTKEKGIEVFQKGLKQLIDEIK